MGKVTGKLNRFIIEPFVPHAEVTQAYITLIHSTIHIKLPNVFYRKRKSTYASIQNVMVMLSSSSMKEGSMLEMWTVKHLVSPFQWGKSQHYRILKATCSSMLIHH